MTYITPSYLSFPASRLRFFLLEKCKRQYAKNIPLTMYPKDVNRIYRSSWLKYTMYSLAEDWFIEHRKERFFHETFDPLIQSDWNKLCIEAAVYSWLAIDEEDRLELHFPKDKTLLEVEISYGLVLQHFEPVMRMACFLTGMTYRDERENFSNILLEDAESYALSETISKMSPEFDQETIRKVVSSLHM